MREMKDSGIPWIGEIPKGWKVMKLRNLGKFSASGIDKKVVEDEPLVRIINYVDIYKNTNKELWEQNYMVVSAPAEKCQEHQVNVGDMFFTPSSETIEDIGVSAVVMEELANTAFSYHIIRFQPTTDIDFNFRKYITNNTACLNYFSSCATGSIRKTISRDVFKECIVPLPPLAEQQRIAEFLDRKCAEVDEMIGLQEQIIEELKAYKQSVITEAVTKGLNPDAPMRDSGIEWIGQIPEHWEVMPHKRVMHKIKEIQEVYNGEKILSLTMRGVIVRDLDGGGKMPTTFDGYQKVYPNNLLQCLFDIDVTPRCVGLIKDEGLTSPAYSQFELFPNGYAPYYDYLLRYMDDIKAMLHLSKNLRNSLTETDFGAIPTCVPPFTEQQTIADYLDEKCGEIDKLIFIKQQKIESLKEYKKSIIYEYVTGKKEVA